MPQLVRQEAMDLTDTNAEDEDDNEFWNRTFLALVNLDVEEPPKTETSLESSLIDLKKLRGYLQQQKSFELELKTGLPRYRLNYLASQLRQTADVNKDGQVSCGEWKAWLHSLSGQDFVAKNSYATGILRVLAYTPSYSCSPPTVFILSITILQILLYMISVYSPSSLGITHDISEDDWLKCSYLILHPRLRKEAWRFVMYMFLHGGTEHIMFNCLMQLMVGVPLEMSQTGYVGSLRVAALYMAGVVSGSVGALVVEPKMYCVGASAGVYALIAAHLATLILNWTEDGIIYKRRCRMYSHRQILRTSMGLNPWIRGMRLLFILAFTAVDIGYAIYLNIILQQPSNTSYAGHACGALAGLLIGVFVLQNRKVDDWEVAFQYSAFSLYGLVMFCLVLWQVIGSYTGWFLPELEADDTFYLKCRI